MDANQTEDIDKVTANSLAASTGDPSHDPSSVPHVFLRRFGPPFRALCATRRYTSPPTA